MALIQYGDLYKIESVREDRPDGLVKQSVLHADEDIRKRATAYKVWLDFQNRSETYSKTLVGKFSKLQKIFWTGVIYLKVYMRL